MTSSTSKTTAADRDPGDAMASILASAAALHRVGAMGAGDVARIRKITAREAKVGAAGQVEPLTGDKIKQIREANHVSQAVFASLINTKVGTLQKWEAGVNAPQGPALKLLNLVKVKGIEVLAQ